MRLYSWNVNGLRAVVKKGLFQKFIAEHKPDILCLQETKAMQGQAEIDLPEYTEYWNSAEKAGYSGTAIFTKTMPKSVINGFHPSMNVPNMRDKYGDPTREGRLITAEYETFFVVTVYTPNSKDDLTRLSLRSDLWDSAFLMHLKELPRAKKIAFKMPYTPSRNDVEC